MQLKKYRIIAITLSYWTKQQHSYTINVFRLAGPRFSPSKTGGLLIYTEIGRYAARGRMPRKQNRVAVLFLSNYTMQ